MIDFGVGEPQSGRTDEEMARGVPSHITVSQLAKASARPAWGRLYYHLARLFMPKQILEMGTCLGISGSYFMAGMQEACSSGTLVTVEGSPKTAAAAEETFRAVGLSDFVKIRVGAFQDIFDAVLGRDGPFDLVFIDGHHDGAATETYFTKILASIGSGIIVCDDIRWSKSMLRAWETIRRHPRVTLSIDVVKVGIIVLDQTAGASVSRN
jgi:predicted O-methyltransferase YrrM